MTRAATHPGADVSERVVGLEHGLDALERRIDERLGDGARTFTIHDRRFDEIEERLAPKPTDKWKAAGLVLTVAVLFFTWIWQAARYPDRTEYNAMSARVEAVTSDITARLQQLRESQLANATELRLLQQRVESLKSEVARIESAKARKRR